MSTEEFTDYEEPVIDNTEIDNLIRTIFNPAMQNLVRTGLNFRQYLNTNQNNNISFNYSNNYFDNDYDIEYNNDINNEYNYDIDSIFSIFTPIGSNFFNETEYVQAQSFENQSDGLEKTDYNLIIASQEFSILTDELQSNNKDCSICTVDYEKDDMISITNCNHIFHTDCIKEWARYKKICPICRADIT